MFVDVLLVLDALGIEHDERGVESHALCPMHHVRTGRADNSPSWWINVETGMHICFSCGYKGNVFQLICDVNEFYKSVWGTATEYDYTAARVWLSQVSEVPIEKLLEMVQSLPNRIEAIPKPIPMSESRLAVFVAPPAEELAKRNITAEAAEQYGILWDDKKSNWILPLRHADDLKLMGWQEKGTLHRTFFNRPTGLQKSKTLFGIEKQVEDVVVVVESPLDCARLASIGVTGAVAICGSSLSEEQVKLLRRSDKIIAAFDNDAAGYKANEELRKMARKYGLNLFFFSYPRSGAKDPGELSDEEILWGLAAAKSSILGESAYVQRDTKTVSG
jgi:hypothetical protein